MTDRLKHLWIMAAALLALVSCAQDDGDGAPLPADGDAVVFTATGIAPLTRATVDGTWDVNTTVKVGIYGVGTKDYVVTSVSADGSATLEAAKGVEPFLWSDVVGKDVTAYTPAFLPNIKDDQSTLANYQSSDCIMAHDPNLTKTTVLEFIHATARVVIKVNNGEVKADKLTLHLKTASSETVITPYYDEDAKEYRAIVARGSYSAVSVKISHGGKDYVHNVSVGADGILLYQNMSYSINLKLDDRFHIYNYNDLKEWAAAVEKSTDKNISCVLENDINISSGDEAWTPVCGNEKEYQGIFDGNGHSIRELNIDASSTDYVGFFASIGRKGVVKDLTLMAAKVNGRDNVGVMAGSNLGTITHCYVGTPKSVNGTYYIGGIAGQNGGTIQFCGVDCNSGNKIQGNQYIGGIAGENYNGNIVGCYAAKCFLEGSPAIGGIVGSTAGGKITACYSECTFNQTTAGGIVGGDNSNIPTDYKACYWKTTQYASNGIGTGSTSDEIKEVTSWDDTTMNAMNTALGDNAEYLFVKNGSISASAEPYKLEKKK